MFTHNSDSFYKIITSLAILYVLYIMSISDRMSTVKTIVFGRFGSVGCRSTELQYIPLPWVPENTNNYTNTGVCGCCWAAAGPGRWRPVGRRSSFRLLLGHTIRGSAAATSSPHIRATAVTSPLSHALRTRVDEAAASPSVGPGGSTPTFAFTASSS